MTTRYEVIKNTGDERWDNYPEITVYDTLEEVIDELDLDDNEVAKLLEDEYLTDPDHIQWEVQVIEDEAG